MKQTTLQQVLDSFKPGGPGKIKVPKTVWRIKVDGQFITVISGKTVWKRIGDAKNALRNHVEAICCLTSDWRGLSVSHQDDLYAKLLPYVEFVELPV